MVDQEVLYRLLCAMKTRIHLILVGDDNQLPSVGAGNVLRELINSNCIPVVRLEQIFRQNEASDIIKVAHKIKNGDTSLDLFRSEPSADVFFYRENDLTKIEDLVIKLATKFKNERRLFQIITPRNEGPLSVNNLNEILQKILNPPMEGLAEIKCFNFTLRRGDRVMVRKNDYENNIFNGDIGKVINIIGGYITVQIDGRNVQLTIEEINEKIKLAYSISVHKAQGMEYPLIILPFINQFGKMLLQRNLLYTAITRAKEKVIIIGHGSALERAINNSSVYKRNTKLGWRVQCLLKTKKNSLPIPPEE
jgi:exodeoxyribonuclease V alpha subunit